jgi:hypothetical protein
VGEGFDVVGCQDDLDGLVSGGLRGDLGRGGEPVGRGDGGRGGVDDGEEIGLGEFGVGEVVEGAADAVRGFE